MFKFVSSFDFKLLLPMLPIADQQLPLAFSLWQEMLNVLVSCALLQLPSELPLPINS
jgi:hypothetical protein